MHKNGGVVIKGAVANLKNISFLLFLLVFLLVFPTLAFAQEQQIQIVIDDKMVLFNEGEQKPLLQDNRTYVPLRVVSESLGYKVEWDDTNNQVLIKTALESIFNEPPKNETNNLRIVIDNKVLHIPEELGKPFISPKGRTLIPLRVTAEALNCDVDWNSGVVAVKSKEKGKAKEEKVAIANKNAEVDKPEVIDFDNIYELPIIGPNNITKEQWVTFLKEQEPLIAEMVQAKFNKKFIPFPYYLIDLYLEIGKEYNIRGDVAFAQALKETGYFQFTGLVKPEQNNYCGLWATGVPLTGEAYHNGVDPSKVFFIPGYHGLTFARPEYGVEAHIQHLYAYATEEPLPADKTLWDPRFKYVRRGIAPKWKDLNGRWAVPGNGYGESIIRDYWLKAFKK